MTDPEEVENAIVVRSGTQTGHIIRYVLVLTVLVCATIGGWKIGGILFPAKKQNKVVIGTIIRFIDADDATQRLHKIILSGSTQPTVLYFIRSDCVWCRRNMENVNVLWSLRGRAYNFVGISVRDPGLKDFVDESGFPFPVFQLAPDNRALAQLNLSATPTTIVVSQEGRVVKYWVGAFNGSSLADVQSFFDVKLPGVKAESDSGL